MSKRNSSNLVLHGALVFLAGMAAGFPYAIAVVTGVGEAAEAYNPEAVRAWRMAHMEGILNGC